MKREFNIRNKSKLFRNREYASQAQNNNKNHKVIDAWSRCEFSSHQRAKNAKSILIHQQSHLQTNAEKKALSSEIISWHWVTSGKIKTSWNSWRQKHRGEIWPATSKPYLGGIKLLPLQLRPACQLESNLNSQDSSRSQQTKPVRLTRAASVKHLLKSKQEEQRRLDHQVWALKARVRRRRKRVRLKLFLSKTTGW